MTSLFGPDTIRDRGKKFSNKITHILSFVPQFGGLDLTLFEPDTAVRLVERQTFHRISDTFAWFSLDIPISSFAQPRMHLRAQR